MYLECSAVRPLFGESTFLTFYGGLMPEVGETFAFGLGQVRLRPALLEIEPIRRIFGRSTPRREFAD